jgi:SAM-dependent methyltransferase
VTAAAYDAMAVRYAEFVRGELDRRPLERAVLAAFAEHVRTSGGGLVADLGCGEGRIGAHLAGLGLDILGIDLSAALTRIATVRYPGLRFAVGSMHALPLRGGALGGAVSWYSVIHAGPGDVPSYFAEFARVLRLGGHLLMAFVEAVGEPVTRYDHTVTPAYRWPPDDLSALASQAGFAEVGRMSREPRDGERFRCGHLLLCRQGAAARQIVATAHRADSSQGGLGTPPARRAAPGWSPPPGRASIRDVAASLARGGESGREGARRVERADQGMGRERAQREGSGPCRRSGGRTRLA